MKKMFEFCQVFLDGMGAIVEHRIFALAVWMFIMFIQDLVKDEWVVTVWNDPTQVLNVPFGAWLLIIAKASIPAFLTLRTYTSNNWNLKGSNENPTNTIPTPSGSSTDPV